SPSRADPASSIASASFCASFRSEVFRLRFHRRGEAVEWTVKQAIQKGDAGCFQRLATDEVRTRVRTSSMLFIAVGDADTWENGCSLAPSFFRGFESLPHRFPVGRLASNSAYPYFPVIVTSER